MLDLWGEALTIAVVITARPSYAKNQGLITALLARGVKVRMIACASALLERYGRVVDVIRQDFPHVPIEEIYSTLEGATLLTSAKETGALLTEMGSVLSRLQPDGVVVTADRHEVLGAAQAAAYLHLPLIHLQGGERSGSIDDRVRDAITQLADIHCVSTKCAQMRVYSLTGSDRVYWTGCPSIDLAKQAMSEPPVMQDELGGSGPRLDLAHPFLVVLQHSVTNEADLAGIQMQATLEAVGAINLPRVVFWSGQDAGEGHASKAIRLWREHRPDLAIHTVRNLPPARFLRLLTQCAVIVGNSSASVRECAYLGTPAVVVGTRQHGRERAANVIDATHDKDQIVAAIERQLWHGRYPSNTLYGDGSAGENICDVVVNQLKNVSGARLTNQETVGFGRLGA